MKKSLVIFIFAGISAMAAETQKLATPKAAVDSTSTQIHSCFSLGGASKACVSVNGNLVSFLTKDGKENVRTPTIAEGYVVVYRNQSGVRQEVFDLAGQGSYGFGPATVIQPNGKNTLPMTIVRDTLDGAIRFTQTIPVNARDMVNDSIWFDMTLKKIGNYSLDNQFSACRFGDIDAGSRPSNAFVSTNNTVVSVANAPFTNFPAPGPGMYMAAPNGAITYIDSWGSQPFKCDQAPNTGDAAGYFVGDGIGMLRWNGAPNPQVTYRIKYGGI